ncbi:hypothetical protein G9A89_002834 [Geosiphon pyriformis]|nr:hypothetical protein G9A89_002834 [Geosiphon pyriformis]
MLCRCHQEFQRILLQTLSKRLFSKSSHQQQEIPPLGPSTSKLEADKQLELAVEDLKSKRKHRKSPGPWASMESGLLDYLVKVHGEDWIRISSQLGNRTPFECRQKFLNQVDPKLDLQKTYSQYGKPWTIQEVRILNESIKNCGARWVKIEKTLGTRPAHLLAYKVQHSPNMFPEVNLDGRKWKRWSNQEIKMLDYLVENYGNQPHLIANHISDRTPTSVSQFLFANYHILPSTRSKNSKFFWKTKLRWSNIEIDLFHKLVKIVGFDAHKIASYLHNRTPIGCKYLLDHLILDFYKDINFNALKEGTGFGKTWHPFGWLNRKRSAREFKRDQYMFWTQKEKQSVQHFFEMYGDRWKMIESHMKWRHYTQIRDFILGINTPTAEEEELITNKSPITQENPSYWSQSELDKLIALVKEHGFEWKKVTEELPERTPSECHLRYLSHMISKDTLAQCGEWTRTERFILWRLVEKYGFQWNLIADYLTSRTAKSCAKKFLNLFGKKIFGEYIREKWSTEEIQKVNKIMKRDGIEWENIAREIGRIPAVVQAYIENNPGFFPEFYDIYKTRVNPEPEKTSPHPRRKYNRSRWENEEIELMKEFLLKHGKDWATLAKILPNRSMTAIKIKFRRNGPIKKLVPTRNLRFWTTEEINQMITLRRQIKDWDSIAMYMVDRTPKACKSKFFYLVSKRRRDSAREILLKNQIE